MQDLSLHPRHAGKILHMKRGSTVAKKKQQEDVLPVPRIEIDYGEARLFLPTSISDVSWWVDDGILLTELHDNFPSREDAARELGKTLGIPVYKIKMQREVYNG